jgi:hypothetical protein
MFNLIVKDPYRIPPERTVWIEGCNRLLRPVAVLELVALQFCANFSRLSNLAVTCQPEESSSLTARFPAQFRLSLPIGEPPEQRQSLKHRSRLAHGSGRRLTA